MDRQTAIDKGKVWQVSTDEIPEKILFEGTKTSCLKWIKDNGLWREYKRYYTIRIGKVIWENNVNK